MATLIVDRAPAPADLEYGAVIDWYKDQLSRQAVFPWAGGRWEPVRIGPTWQTTPDGHWLLPDASIGWQAIGWAGTRLQLHRGQPWRYTLEQARWVLWWFSLDEAGRFLYRDAVLQRLKGAGKDPVLATLALIEAFGPARFLEWDGDDPIATDVPGAWIQLAAVALEQTKNTTRLFPSLLTDEAKEEYGIRVGKEMIYGLGDERLIQAVTSSPSTLEGARSTFTGLNETHHWLANNDGHEMAAVIERNATKSADGAARTLAVTNAYEPSEDSVAQRTREAWEMAEAGASRTSGLLYDSLEAPPEAPLTAEDAPEVVQAIRGDSVWLDVGRITQSILDTRNPPSRSRRFWFNQVTATEDAWLDPQDFDLLAAPAIEVAQGERIALFFDGSKSDDATGLVGCRLSDGHVLTLGMWQSPPGERGKLWTAPRDEVDQRVKAVFEQYHPVVFWADPSHTRDDVTDERYWDALIDEWHRRYSTQLELWAQPGRHAVMWDMSSPQRSADFTAAAERCLADIESAAVTVRQGGAPTFTWDGDGRLRRHTHNAKRFPNRWGVSIWKGHRESARKIDLAACMVGARMARRQLQLVPEKPEKATKRPGNVVAWGRR